MNRFHVIPDKQAQSDNRRKCEDDNCIRIFSKKTPQKPKNLFMPEICAGRLYFISSQDVSFSKKKMLRKLKKIIITLTLPLCCIIIHRIFTALLGVSRVVV